MPSLQAREQGTALVSVPRPLAARSCRHRKDAAKRTILPSVTCRPCWRLRISGSEGGHFFRTHTGGWKHGLRGEERFSHRYVPLIYTS